MNMENAETMKEQPVPNEINVSLLLFVRHKSYMDFKGPKSVSAR
jgi:hypothetical protein